MTNPNTTPENQLIGLTKRTIHPKNAHTATNPRAATMIATKSLLLALALPGIATDLTSPTPKNTEIREIVLEVISE